MAEPDNPALALLLAKLLVSQGRYEDAYSVLSSLPEGLGEREGIRVLHMHLEMILAGRDTRSADELTGVLEKAPDDAEARFALAAAALTADDYDTALEQIAELVRRAPGYRKGQPRRALMVLLDTLEPDDARMKRFRQALFDH